MEIPKKWTECVVIATTTFQAQTSVRMCFPKMPLLGQFMAGRYNTLPLKSIKEKHKRYTINPHTI